MCAQYILRVWLSIGTTLVELFRGCPKCCSGCSMDRQKFCIFGDWVVRTLQELVSGWAGLLYSHSVVGQSNVGVGVPIDRIFVSRFLGGYRIVGVGLQIGDPLFSRFVRDWNRVLWWMGRTLVDSVNGST